MPQRSEVGGSMLFTVQIEFVKNKSLKESYIFKKKITQKKIPLSVLLLMM